MPWEITRDHLFEQIQNADEAARYPSNVGRTSADEYALPTSDKQVAFRLIDDDDVLYYEGTLDDDEECENQSNALAWAGYDSGCTTIMVRRGSEWVQDIG